jgi:hypothetical protein
VLLCEVSAAEAAAAGAEQRVLVRRASGLGACHHDQLARPRLNRCLKSSRVSQEEPGGFRKSVDSITVTNVERLNCLPKLKSVRPFEPSGID